MINRRDIVKATLHVVHNKEVVIVRLVLSSSTEQIVSIEVGGLCSTRTKGVFEPRKKVLGLRYNNDVICAMKSHFINSNTPKPGYMASQTNLTVLISTPYF